MFWLQTAPDEGASEKAARKGGLSLSSCSESRVPC